MQELLRRLPDGDTTPERLRTLLAPLFATSPAQQRRFYEIFDLSLAQARDLTGEPAPGPDRKDPTEKKDEPPAPQPSAQKSPGRALLLLLSLLPALLFGYVCDAGPGIWYFNYTWLLAAAAATAAGLAGFLFLTKGYRRRIAYVVGLCACVALGAWVKQRAAYRPPVTAPDSYRFPVAPGDTVEGAFVVDTTRIVAISPKEPVHTRLGGTFRVNPRTGRLTYLSDTAAHAGATDSLRVIVAYAERTDTTLVMADLTEKSAPPPPTLPGTNRMTEMQMPYPDNLEALRVDAAAATRYEWLRRYEWPAKALLALLLGALAWAVARWDRLRKAKAVAELRRADKAPYVWKPDIGTDTSDLLAAVAQPLLTRLRGRAPDERLRLDVRATVRATSRCAGRITFAWRRHTLPPDFLLLIDRLAPNDHRAQLFDALYAAFKKAEAPVTRYFYDGDPRRCYDENHPLGIGLAELLHRHAGAQLLIVGEGQGLLSTQTGRPAPWTNLLDTWPRRALLTPNPLGAWGARERQLAELLPLLPASPGGLGAALDLFGATDPLDARDLLRNVRDALRRPVTFEHDLLDDLHRHFDPHTVDWIAACALWPTLHWDLTLHLGRTLDALQPGAGSAAETAFERLRELSRLPWFTEGRIPGGARARLLDHLAARDLETPLRESLRDLLRQTPAPPTDSVAYDDYRMNVVLNELFLQPSPAERRRLEREFERFLAAGKKPDFVALRLLDRPANRLDVLVGDRLKKYAFREGLPGLGWRLGAKLFGLWAVLVAALFLLRPASDPCPGERVRFLNAEYCLNSDRDRLTYLEQLAALAVAMQKHDRVDSLRRAADAIHPNDTIFFQNTAARYYNAGVRCYNCAQGAGSDCLDLWPDSLRALACKNFRYGDYYYTANTGESGYQFFEAIRLACPAENVTTAAPPPTEFAFRGMVLDAATGKALRNAEVRVEFSTRRAERRSGGPNFLVNLIHLTTDVAGRYTLRMAAKDVAGIVVLYTMARGYTRDTLRLDALRDPLPTIRLRSETANIDADQIVDEICKAVGLSKNFVVRPSDVASALAAIENGQRYILYNTQFLEKFNANPRTRWAIYLALAHEIGHFENRHDLSEQNLTRRKEMEVEADRFAGGALRLLGAPLDEAQDGIQRLTSQPGSNIYRLPLSARREAVAQGWKSQDDRLEAQDPSIRAANEIAAFNAAYRANTTEAYEDFLRRYPDASLADEARLRLARLNDPTKAAALDAAAWAVAQKAGTPEACQKYLQQYPQGQYAAAARACATPDRPKRSGLEMVPVPGGTFTMGCRDGRDKDCYDDEKPAHEVTLSDFQIGKYEVTQADWRDVMGSDPRGLWNKGCDECPVENVSWGDVQEFLKKLNAKTGRTYRLPTEAEWEYAARGGARSKGYRYAGGDDLDKVGWYGSNYSEGNTFGEQKTTHPVGLKAPNELGLYDMSGNVLEWCADWYGDYPSEAQTNPAGPGKGTSRVRRGGSWFGDAQYCRPASRYHYTPGVRIYSLGFRLALSLPQ